MKRKIFLLLLAITLFQFHVGLCGLLVSTNYGKIEGTTIKPEESEQICPGFLRVPFAKPPLGNLRFEKPQPPDPWTDILKTQKGPPRCPQLPGLKSFPGPEGIPDSEDCLYLNIILPNKEIKPENRYPVMFWVHGGGFAVGSVFEYEAEEICRNLVSKDVIVVETQYRIGVYGFLASGDAVAPGNYGLHDQILALKWTHENIANFGGDPGKITIFGESAGGASVSLLNHFPQAAPYYTQTIAQSGNAGGFWSISKKPVVSFHKLSATLGCSVPASGQEKANNQHKVDCIRKKTADEIDKAHQATFGPNLGERRPKLPGRTYQGGGHRAVGMILNWGPTVDLDLIPHGGWINMVPSSKPFITGTAEEEMLLFLKPPPMLRPFFGGAQDDRHTTHLIDDDNSLAYSTLEENIQEAIFIAKNPLKGYKFNVTKAGQMGREDLAAELAYSTSQGNKENKTLLARQIMRLGGDTMFNVPCVLDADKTKKAGAATWLYSLEHSTTNEWPADTEWKAPTHASDLPLLFTRLSKLLPSKFNEKDEKMRLMMSKLWTDFAKHGTPESSDISWPQFQSLDNPVHLKIKLQPEVSNDYHRDTVPFWTILFPKMRENLDRKQKENIPKRHQEL